MQLNNVPYLILFSCNKKMYLCLATLTSTFSYESGEEFLDLLVRELSDF